LYPHAFPGMNKISFVLKNPLADKDTAIKLLYSCSDGRLQYYTGESVHPGSWPGKVNKGTQAVLNRIQAAVEQTATDYKVKGDPLTKEALRISIDAALKRKGSINGEPMFEAVEAVIQQIAKGMILTKNKKRYEESTIRTFRFTANLLKKFDPQLSIAATTLSTYSRFISWCQKQDYSTNYIGVQIKNWKTLGQAVGGNLIFADPAFRKIQEETHDVYLDEKELALIFKQKVNDRQAVSRDWFILDCYTGLRVSDLRLLTKKNVRNGYITIANEKTDEKVVIPVHPFVQKILNKYKGFPPAITDVEINRTIKQVAKLAGIDSDVLYTITKGGKRQDHYLKKWQMVSNHTARRSFITNLRKNGVPDSIIMKLTGIKSAATLKRYDKLTAEEAAGIAAQHKFFK
jgi:integrase